MKTNVFNNNKDYSLNNVDNYNKKFEYKVEDVIDKYILLIDEFLKFILEKNKIKNNNNSKFIIIRGYETITNVFNIILYSTKNLELTIYHSQKAYYYYIEFIEQISNVDHILLQLNSRDASIYVYKKTLSELNHDTYKKNSSYPNDIKALIEIIDEYIKVFKVVFEFLLQFLDVHLCTFDIIKVIDRYKLICQIFLKKNLKIHNNVKKIYNEFDCINNDFLHLYESEILYKNVNNVNNINMKTSNETILDKYLNYISQKLK